MNTRHQRHQTYDSTPVSYPISNYNTHTPLHVNTPSLTLLHHLPHTHLRGTFIGYSIGNKVIQLKIIAANGTFPYYVQFNCDASATAITTSFGAAGGPNTTVIVNQYGNFQYGSANYSIGYSDRRTIGKNWYRPIIMSAPTGVHVTINTLQEGGYLNSHYNATYSVTPLVQSLWVRPIGTYERLINASIIGFHASC